MAVSDSEVFLYDESMTQGSGGRQQPRRRHPVKEFLQALSPSYPRPLPQLWKALPIKRFNDVEGMESFFP